MKRPIYSALQQANTTAIGATLRVHVEKGFLFFNSALSASLYFRNVVWQEVI